MLASRSLLSAFSTWLCPLHNRHRHREPHVPARCPLRHGRKRQRWLRSLPVSCWKSCGTRAPQAAVGWGPSQDAAGSGPRAAGLQGRHLNHAAACRPADQAVSLAAPPSSTHAENQPWNQVENPGHEASPSCPARPQERENLRDHPGSPPTLKTIIKTDYVLAGWYEGN